MFLFPGIWCEAELRSLEKRHEKSQNRKYGTTVFTFYSNMIGGGGVIHSFDRTPAKLDQ